MSQETTKTIKVTDQLSLLKQAIVKTRTTLQTTRFEFPSGTLEALSQSESNIDRLTRAVAGMEAQYSQLSSLAEIGQVVNSSLDLDEVLRIVMDTIVRLTKAERGFLMLRDENGEMVSRTARNWEQE